MRAKKAGKLLAAALMGTLTGCAIPAMVQWQAGEMYGAAADGKACEVREVGQGTKKEKQTGQNTGQGSSQPVLWAGAGTLLRRETDQESQYQASLERRTITLSRESYLAEKPKKKIAENKKKAKKTKKTKKKEKWRSRTYKLPGYKGYHGFKSYEPYSAITSRDTPQWRLRLAAKTDKRGLRRVDERICVALGSYFGTKVGQYFDLILKNGTVIPCIMGDEKADRHTDEKYHIYTVHSACCSEFLVDSRLLRRYIGGSGDVSDLMSRWDSPVEKVRVYEKNYFD